MTRRRRGPASIRHDRAGRPRRLAAALLALALTAMPALAQDAAPPTTPPAGTTTPAPQPGTSPVPTQTPAATPAPAGTGAAPSTTPPPVASPATGAETSAPSTTAPRVVQPNSPGTAPETAAPAPATGMPAQPAAATPPTSPATGTQPSPTAGPAADPSAVAAPPTSAQIPPGASTADQGASDAADEGLQPLETAGDDEAPNATLPHDLSPWGMFMAADWVVKSVMIGLAFASLVTWTIWLAKAMELSMARSRAKRGVRRLEDAASLSEVASVARGSKWPRRGPVAALVAAAEDEIARSGDMAAEGVKERTQVALQRIEARAGRSMARGTGLLATIGSTAPFVGLFGTVWGIMNSFIGISEANTTNLAVVAPGIAEALLATAIGLVAAIPAVIIYNVFARSIAGYRAVLADASAEVLRHLSRDLDRRTHARLAQGATAGRLQAAE